MKKTDIFEKYFSNEVRQQWGLFPETDSQMSICEKNLEDFPLPEKFKTPDFIFNTKMI